MLIEYFEQNKFLIVIFGVAVHIVHYIVAMQQIQQ